MPLNFVDRHNGPREHQIKHMLDVIGVSSIDELIRQTIPSDILLKEPLKLDGHISEHAYLARLRKTVAKNKDFRSMIGLGFYGTASLPVITRNIFENPSWYTSYTPYQAEISQGRLEALINFQTMISSLTGFPMSNCSMLDDATAAGEAMRMIHELRSRDAVKAGKNTFFVDRNIFPQVLSVVETRAKGLGIKIELGDYRDVLEKGFSPECYGALLQYPAADGEVRDYSAFCEAAHKAGILVAAHCDLLALAVMKEPVQEKYPRTYHRHIGGPSRQTCLPPCSPDPRAAHQEREGHIQYMHGHSPDGSDVRHVRRLSRSRGHPRDSHERIQLCPCRG